ncbi:CYTH and CHAD domain-containing protein [Sphingomonas sediminicola]|uniref:CYTH and CHAD domain-containing protein n=1 Tax=Sphingomonas sediminicola TaxID=386874 RepID=A0ABX6T7M9_9SPHN|nr:inorganic triphosphatase [Sphingomonas sediminicola]QNP45564.1 CYTH and CHAD domain-containing protein [Sphingomonas sediminicola]
MKHGTNGEVELKFELDGRAAKKARRHPLLSKTDHRTKVQRSIYFDTDDSDAYRAGYSLRVRDDGNSFTQTVKTNGGSAGLFDRREWEARVEQIAPDPDALRQTPLGKIKKLTRDAKPVVWSEVERTTWLINRDGSIVEVALDSGSIRADGKEAPLHELELELRQGKQASLFAIAQELGRVVPLHVGVLSKEERGRMLARGAFGHEHKARAIDLRKKMDAGQAFATIVYECIRHFRLNETLIIEQRDPHALHQARVAIRRLRSAFTFFRPAIQQGSLEPLREELRGFIAPSVMLAISTFSWTLTGRVKCERPPEADGGPRQGI